MRESGRRIFCYLCLLERCYSVQFGYKSFEWKTHTHSLNRMHIQKVILMELCNLYFLLLFSVWLLLLPFFSFGCYCPRMHWNEAAAFRNRNSNNNDQIQNDVYNRWMWMNFRYIFPYTFFYRLVCRRRRRRRRAEPAILLHSCCPVELGLFPSCMLAIHCCI